MVHRWADYGETMLTWGYDTDEKDGDLIRRTTDDTRAVWVQLAILKELKSISQYIANLDPEIRKKRRKEKKAEEAATYLYEKLKHSWRKDTERRAAWLRPVVNRLFRRTMPDIHKDYVGCMTFVSFFEKVDRDIDRCIINTDYHGIHRIAKALKGSPNQWRVTDIYGCGPVFAKQWDMVCKNERA